MTYLHAIILGIVEGITEFLPISSTGHLILASELLHLPNTDFQKSFDIIIQLGAILAVAVLYFDKLIDAKKMWPKLLMAFIPTGIIGVTLYSFVKEYLIGNSFITIVALFVGGIILLFIDKLTKKSNLEIEQSKPQNLITIGILQSISMIPGVSRSAASIIAGQLAGLNRQSAVEFSFLLAIPTMIAATGLDLFKTNFSFSPSEISLLSTGFITAFVTAFIAIKSFIRYVQNHSFAIFGIYRILLALLFWFIL